MASRRHRAVDPIVTRSAADRISTLSLAATTHRALPASTALVLGSRRGGPVDLDLLDSPVPRRRSRGLPRALPAASGAACSAATLSAKQRRLCYLLPGAAGL